MTFSQRDLDRIVTLPSLGAVTYQAEFAIEQLSSITGPSFPREAHRVRDVLLCIASRVLGELRDLYDPADPRGLRGGHGNARRVRDLASCLRNLFAWLRYLRTTSTEFCPAAIQRAIFAIAQQYLGRNGDNVACLVRPKWNYNFSHYPLQDDIDRMVDTVVFDLQGETPGSSTSERFQRVWEKWRAGLPSDQSAQTDPTPPANIFVVAFAGLDTQDVLLWPLLVHEMAHAISQGPHRGYLEAILRALPVDKSIPAATQDEIRARQMTLIRELLADAIAVRIMGFSYFCAQAETLKTVHEWPGEPMEDSGHPGVRVRLAKIFSYLQQRVGAPTLTQFLTAHNQQDAKELLRYLQRWEQHIDADHAPSMDSNGVISAVAEAIIPQEQSATLAETFFDRIDLLRSGQAPHLTGDTSYSFAEIMSASWAYEILSGEQREIEAGEREAHSQRREYRKTCDLILQACDDLL
jgi:hypothetical protein